jgi:hypothetical protein
MTAHIGGKQYSTATSALLAQGEHEGGPAWMPQTQFAFLFRSKSGEYFAQFRAGLDPKNRHSERYWVEPLTELDAIPIYWELPEKLVSFETAFSGRNP